MPHLIVDLESKQWTVAALFVAASRVRMSDNLRFLQSAEEARDRLLALEFDPALVRWWYDKVSEWVVVSAYDVRHYRFARLVRSR